MGKARELEEAERDEVERPVLRQSVGKCFTFTNSYGGADKKWPLYAKIVGFDEQKMTFETVQFQRTSRNIVEIESRREYNFDGKSRFNMQNGWTEITSSDYNKARREALEVIHKLLERA
jgi:hypothetical protein